MGDDIITAREQALEALAELGKDQSNSSHLVLYVPRARPLDQEAVWLDPFTPVVLAGGVFPDGAGDSYLALCQRFLPEQAGVIEEMFRHGEPTFLEINSLVLGADGAPVLSGLLGAEGTQDLFVRFLCLNAKDAKRLKQSPHWRKELQTLVSKTLGLALPEDLTVVDELRHLLWRFLLFSEFAADLPVALPAALGAVPKAAPRYHRFVFDLCSTLRDRTSAQQTYEEFAHRVADELGLETHCGALDDLGALDTFAFEVRCFLRTFAKVALAGDLEKAGRFVAERSKSFWIRDGARAGEWKLAGCAQLPTITKIGMAALLPGAGGDFRVAVELGELVPLVKGRPLPGLPQRLDYIKEVVGANRFAAVELTEINTAKDFASLNHVEVLVVRTSDIDQIGENNPGYLIGRLPGAVRELQLALNRLADAGFSAAVLATDHGFCWFDSAESGDAIQKPAGEWVEVKNRALLGAGQPNSQVVCVEAAHVGIRGQISRYVAARGLATFTKGIRYFHEGLSLQECLLPIVQVVLKPSPTKITADRVELFLTYRGANTGTVTTLRPSVEVSLPGGDLFGPADVSFVLEGFDSAGQKVAEAASSPVTDPATGVVRMLRGQSVKVPIRIQEGFNGRLEIRAAHPGTGEIFAMLKLATDFHH